MSLKRLLFAALGLLLALSLIPTRSAAQDQEQNMTTGGVTGVVVDTDNTILIGARVILKNVAKGTTQQTSSNNSGSFQFILLDPGDYTVTVEAQGYITAVKQVNVPVGEPVVVNFQLQFQPKGVSVAPPPGPKTLLQTDNGTREITLTQQQVFDLPNQGDDLTYLGQLAPGAVMNTEKGYGHFSISGMPATSNGFSINGMDDNEPFLNINNSGATTLLVGTGEIQEMTITTNGYGGKYNEFAGSNINYVTRAGSDSLHGNATYYWNGSKLNANSWLNNQAGNVRPFDNVNEWSASVGGPLKRDKLYFFFDTEGLRVLMPSTQTVITPSAQFEGSIVQNLENTLPNSTVFYCQGLQVTPPNESPIICPSSSGVQTNPPNVHLGSGILNIFTNAPNQGTATDNLAPKSFPDPNNAGNTIYTGDGCGTFTGDPNFGVSQASTLPAPTGLLPCALSYVTNSRNYAKELSFSGRGDYIIGTNDKVFVRYQQNTGSQTAYSDPIDSAFNAVGSFPEHQGQLEETHQYGNTGTNQFLLGVQWFSSFVNTANPSLPGVAFPAQLHFADGSFTDVGGNQSFLPRGRSSTAYQFSDDFSRTWGSATLRFGGSFRRMDVSNHDYGLNTIPYMQVLTLNDFYNGGATGDVFSQSFPSSLTQPMAYYTAGAYAEDDWKFSDTLNFTLAIRGEHDSNIVCRHLCFSRLTGPFGQIANGTNGQSIGDVPYSTVIANTQEQAFPNYQTLLWSPRASMAWRPFGPRSTTVVRAGGGLYHDLYPAIVADMLSSNPPQLDAFTVLNNNISPTEFTNVFDSASLANTAFQSGYVSADTVSEIASNNPTFIQPNIAVTDKNMQAPEYQRWDLEIQHALGADTLVSAAYVGNHGIHLPVINYSANAYGVFDLPTGTVPPPGETYPTGQTNVFPSGQCAGTSTPCTGSDPRFAQVTVITASGVSHYNGGTVSFQHRFTKYGSGAVMVNYTYSRATDEVSNGGILPFNQGESPSLMSPQDPTVFTNSYGPSDYDVRHSLNANYVWDIPFRKFFSGHGPSRLTDGWELTGTVFFRTGLPYSITDAQESSSLSAFNYYGTVLPNPTAAVPVANCDKSAAGIHGVPCLPISAFPAPGTETSFGVNGLRNLFRGPKYFDTDLTLTKSTRLPGWSRASLLLGVQAFNLLNHPNFDLPISNISNPLFGTIQQQVSPPTSILGIFPGGNASSRILQVKAELRF